MLIDNNVYITLPVRDQILINVIMLSDPQYTRDTLRMECATEAQHHADNQHCLK